MRLHQELVLGVGGVRALRALGIAARRRGTSTRATRRSCWWSGPASWSPTGVPFEEALERSAPRSVFTIHTPVSAGNERFDADLVRTLAAPMMQERGRGHGAHPGARPRRRRRPLPVRHDGVLAAPVGARQRRQPAPRRDRQRHLAATMPATHPGHHQRRPPGHLAGRPRPGAVHAGSAPTSTGIDDDRPKDRFWERLPRVSDERLWDAHMEQKLELALFARGRLRMQFARHGEPPGRAARSSRRSSTRRS